MPKERGSRYLTASQSKALVEDYKAGESITNVCIRYGIGRSTLYRHIRVYEDKYGALDKPSTFYKLELQRLKDVLADVMMQNADLKKQLHDCR